jgi:hypothetical protein
LTHDHGKYTWLGYPVAVPTVAVPTVAVPSAAAVGVESGSGVERTFSDSQGSSRSV